MRILIVFCHPTPDSFQGSLLEALCARLAADGHELKVLDLYAEGFDPVLGAQDWRAHRQGRGHPEGLQAHIEALERAEGLVLVYPAWWFGLPAMLKGWLDRVWQPGVAFEMKEGVFQPHGLDRIRRFAAITTYGSPRWLIEWIVGDPLRRQLVRGLRQQLARGCRTCWAPIYAVDGRSREDLARARAKAVDKVGRLFA